MSSMFGDGFLVLNFEVTSKQYLTVLERSSRKFQAGGISHDGMKVF